MCRLFGAIGLQPINLQFWFFNAQTPFTSLASEHSDGWGIAWNEAQKSRVFKEGREDVTRFSFHKVRDIREHLVIAHLRRASTHIKGACRANNTHPFVYKNWSFCHNGGFDHMYMLKHLSPQFRESIKGDTDSEIYFLHLMQEYAKSKNILTAIITTLKVIKEGDYKGLNFILSDGEKLYAYRDVNPSMPECFAYYSLHFLVR